jgi:hypothetical protein
MLVVGYVFAIRSERLICREVQVNRIAPVRTALRDLVEDEDIGV